MVWKYSRSNYSGNILEIKLSYCGKRPSLSSGSLIEKVQNRSIQLNSTPHMCRKIGSRIRQHLVAFVGHLSGTVRPQMYSLSVDTVN